jgi:hypothetical protein
MALQNSLALEFINDRYFEKFSGLKCRIVGNLPADLALQSPTWLLQWNRFLQI